MRSLHRWLTTVFSVVLVYVAATGLLIETVDLYVLGGFSAHPEREIGSINGGEQFLDPHFTSLGPGIPWPDASQTALATDPAPLLARILPVLAREARGAPIASVTWKSIHGVAEFDFGFSGSQAPLSINGVSGAVIPQAGGGPPPPGGISWHDEFKAFHAGRVLGIFGSWAIVLTGTALIVLCGSGLYLYATMWVQRRGLGRHGWFWRGKQEPLLWRRLHRYVSLLAFLVLAYLAVTGTMLALDDVVVRYSPIYDLLRTPLPGELDRSQPAPLDGGAVAAQVVRVRAAAEVAAAGRPVLSLTLTAGQDAQVVVGGARASVDLFDPATGAWSNRDDPNITSESPYVGSMPYHALLQRLHTGAIVGVGGRALIVAGDFSLLYLCVSGIVMYFQMLGRRRKIGARGWFWGG